MSYIVGYSSKYPKRIHHRASTLPSIDHHPQKFGCLDGKQYFDSPKPDLNVLVGAVVGGPDANDYVIDNCWS
ncbi:hypothetical protein Tsubulata_004034 [Turnera subulata]|uniref:cellulase n=1 Tax=Turnera subulata TaxID=218843 RepID=A0A9Q0GB00_9ROSI|nr:hypothetical protein Tsubulata_004034 [Turnera subulata]